NIQTILKASNGKNIRIASKSIRSLPILKDILNYSATFQGVMCFTADEAIYLNNNGLNDLLIAYPVWDTNQLKKVANRVSTGQTLTLMIDSIEHIKHLEHIASQNQQQFLVCLDIDLSTKYPGLHFGVHRSSIKTVKQAIKLVNRIIKSPYLKLDGLMVYEAYITGVTDNNTYSTIINCFIRLLKNDSSKKHMKKRKKIIQLNKQNGINLRFINVGGTGSLHQTLTENVTEATVGSEFFNSRLFENY